MNKQIGIKKKNNIMIFYKMKNGRNIDSGWKLNLNVLVVKIKKIRKKIRIKKKSRSDDWTTGMCTLEFYVK